MPSHLMTRAEYARRIGVSRQAVAERVKNGLIPAHGPRKLIDPAEADRLWHATMSPARVLGGQSRAKIPPPGAVPPAETSSRPEPANAPAHQTDPAGRVQSALLVTRVHRQRLELDAYKASLVDVALVRRQVHALADLIAASFGAWPAKAATALAAELGVDPKRLRQALERHVREHLADLAKQPLPELKAGLKSA